VTGSPNIMFIASPRRQPKSGIRLGDEAALILSSGEVDGRIVAFAADVHNGYEITIESQKPQ